MRKFSPQERKLMDMIADAGSCDNGNKEEEEEGKDEQGQVASEGEEICDDCVVSACLDWG